MRPEPVETDRSRRGQQAQPHRPEDRLAYGHAYQPGDQKTNRTSQQNEGPRPNEVQQVVGTKRSYGAAPVGRRIIMRIHKLARPIADVKTQATAKKQHQSTNAQTFDSFCFGTSLFHSFFHLVSPIKAPMQIDHKPRSAAGHHLYRHGPSLLCTIGNLDQHLEAHDRSAARPQFSHKQQLRNFLTLYVDRSMSNSDVRWRDKCWTLTNWISSSASR